VARETGRVKWFDTAKGYGFIEPDGGGRDIFVHYTEIEGTGYRNLEEGEAVEYEPTPTEKGMSAMTVTRLERE
jgi:CspA family cold shock protein